ncbi:hypothetical protein [Rodentibacter pneumotropicus]|nr:hypothetical protein [Rodentibacter pneumotropicus]
MAQVQEIDQKTNRTFTYIYRHPNSYEPLAQCVAHGQTGQPD